MGRNRKRARRKRRRAKARLERIRYERYLRRGERELGGKRKEHKWLVFKIPEGKAIRLLDKFKASWPALYRHKEYKGIEPGKLWRPPWHKQQENEDTTEQAEKP